MRAGSPVGRRRATARACESRGPVGRSASAAAAIRARGAAAPAFLPRVLALVTPFFAAVLPFVAALFANVLPLVPPFVLAVLPFVAPFVASVLAPVAPRLEVLLDQLVQLLALVGVEAAVLVLVGLAVQSHVDGAVVVHEPAHALFLGQHFAVGPRRALLLSFVAPFLPRVLPVVLSFFTRLLPLVAALLAHLGSRRPLLAHRGRPLVSARILRGSEHGEEQGGERCRHVGLHGSLQAERASARLATA
jgi:hypothetical protein